MFLYGNGDTEATPPLNRRPTGDGDTEAELAMSQRLRWQSPPQAQIPTSTGSFPSCVSIPSHSGVRVAAI